jgi:transposase
MRKIQNYTLKGKDIFIGLEDSKRTWKINIRCNKMEIKQLSIPAEYENLIGYLSREYPECRIKLMYESGFSGFWLHDQLESDGVDCIVTPAHTVTMEKVSKVKTDKRDARRLAINLENGDYKECYVPDKETREDRQISRVLTQIQVDITRTKNQIRGLLKFHGLEKGLNERKWTDKDYLELEKLKTSYSLQICLTTYLTILKTLLEEEKKLKAELLKLMKKDKYQKSANLKESCPGIGKLTAIRLTLEWGDMGRFKDGKSIASFTGLTCSEYSTGEEIRKGRITGQGRGIIRGWIIQCSWASIKTDAALMTKFQNVWKNSGSKKKAIIAVGRKLVVRMRAIELKNQRYLKGILE